MEVWKFIQQKLNQNLHVILLWVLQSEGSSPGRRGFKMAVSEDDDFVGTIGGGIMEHKLVEKAKAILADASAEITLQNQYHDKLRGKDQSGMICSGKQLIAFVPLRSRDKIWVNELIIQNPLHFYLQLSKKGISIYRQDENIVAGLDFKNDEQWIYSEKLDQRPVIHIIGGGHVGLALSELMHYLDFYIKIYDNRPQLNTMEQNKFAHEKHIVDYENIGELVTDNEEEYVAIMTFGYRDDKIVFKQLLNKKYYYLGMLGSESKIKTLYKELEEEGVLPLIKPNFHIPIGINIFSKTSKEIAVSIAAEIIKEKNKHLPTGRSKR
jgi:xanthine dehydrogenase accessory factor